jgi:hypothetical protein
MTNVPGAQLNQAAEMLDFWFKAKHQSNNDLLDERYLRSILNGIGINVLTVQKQLPTRNGRAYQVINTDLISDQNRCPIQHFGSEAGGQYRVYSFWDRLSEEDILHEVGETGFGQPPVIVFYFGRLTDRKRRDLAKLSKERRRTFLIIDEMLIVYLCGERGSRLPIFFKCTMPFTFLEPYTTTASLVPPEMFYGRKDELKSIMEGKSGLVYGGRQLGKTALLREAERNFHNPVEGRYALWIDLKAEGIGYNKPIDEIWNLIARELHRVGLLDIKPNSTSPEKLFDQIMSWLDGQSNRRILLLLDEADRFLEIDANDYGSNADTLSKSRAGFIRCARIKGVIERTNKRFHVVFAGLHNVQRSVKNQNDPLAHLGSAICVGPLFTKDEWHEAWNLIVKPFASMGYFFESSDLITRILSQTNYYPSLIQLYCHQLLRHMTEHRILASFNTKTPPYIITSRHVDEAYQDRELQQAIRHRFHLTLQLDPRYELIAYYIAYESLASELVARQGIPSKQIREQSIIYWSDGMNGIAADSFRILLDEMVDLGVLRRVKEGFYSLRSPNLLSLMGSANEIEEELLREDREVRNEFSASNFRQVYVNGGTDFSMRSPLTAEQESELYSTKNRVSVIFGNRAAGVLDIEKFINLSDKVVKISRGITEQRNFIQLIQDYTSTRSKRASEEILILVNIDCAWSLEWIKEANGLLNSPKFSHVRVVFLADPEQTYTLVRMSDDILSELNIDGILTLQLKPWHEMTLVQWLSDCELEKTKSVQKEITELTGNWPSILGRLYGITRVNPHQLKQHLIQFRKQIIDGKLRIEILEEMGVCRKDVKEVLGVLVILEEASYEDLQTICISEYKMHEKQISSILQWAELLGLVRYVGKDLWRVDEVLGLMLSLDEVSTQ